ncbi:UvrD-helicase domain-containing protein [Opitutus sp. ER46]|uniref:UvrD-helicase domain-containing protein n=1 Tax=Opitutus sp. ER46 TaxID=2161864 RepID=UPI000D2F89DD|nr:UvrD-helicase domain-containing protein [Opitutus sp. ER46]PTX91730.1 DNA helicase UvrD [Opitutus sp. ER46]
MTPASAESLRHVMILASAGSGKTYALTNRFVELLAAGAAPDRIVALTFTRKAAGEFFDEILRKLARAASDPAEARRMGGDIGRAGMTPADFLRLLRQMIDAMHRMKLGTLDSFFARIARTFPMELGLAGEFEILQEHAARLERQRVLRQMFARAAGTLDAAQNEFIEAFKRATFGAEEKQFGARLDAFIDAHQENYLAAPDRACWGDPARIWPDGAPWFAPELKLADAIRDLRAALGELTDGQRGRWEGFFAALAEWAPGAPLPKPLEYVFAKAVEAWDDLCGGSVTLTIDRRKLTLAPGACRALHQIVQYVIGQELRRRLETTRGIYAVLRGYEATYHAQVRRAGRLTFADVQRLLQPVTLTREPVPRTLAEPAGGESGEDADAQLDLFAPAPGEAEAEERLFLDYRLDAEIDHWLLDEFQDTSFGQWSVLRNLIDEVVQDPSGRRSFFCVGDVKQAIYSWREGDPRLFREIFNHYNAAAPGAIAERHLVASWRSGPPLIEMVNTVFGAAETLEELFPGEASRTWNREWRAHESAVPQRAGQAALLVAADETERWAATRRLLEEIQPFARGLTCAILVQRNATAAALADELRRAGIAALAESDLQIATDNPLGAALLALVQAAAHPGDTLAWEHVAMTPLAAVLAAHGLTTRETLTRHVLAQIQEDGFEPALAWWIAQLEPGLAADDGFSRARARELAAAAAEFDATGSRDIGEFIAFMERHTVRPPESAAVVRVMTIHKSKGLGFDVVILPDLEGTRIDQRRDGLAVQKAPDRSVAWVLDLPPRLFCERDAVLSAHVREAEAEACYESLSLVYVALTRAKRAMYVITETVGRSTSRNVPMLLAKTLGAEPEAVRVGGATFTGGWSSGDPDWHLALPTAGAGPAASAEAQRLPQLGDDAVPGTPRFVSRRPSGGGAGALPAGLLFELEAADAREFGTALHACLAEVEWADAAGVGRWAAAWQARGEPEELIAAATAALRAPELAPVWQCPDGLAELWRERSFEIVLDRAWVTGVFDRVVVRRDRDGRATSAVVYDFKTDRVGEGGRDVASAVRRYREQLGLYRRVAAVLTALPVECVRCELVFTAAGQRVTVTE